MFDFRIIEGQNGSQVIDTTLKTPFESLTPVQMVDYIEVEEQLLYMKKLKAKQDKQSKRKRNPLLRLANVFGIM